MAYQFVLPYIDWALANPTRHGVSFVLVSTQSASGPQGAQQPPPVGFATGVLRLHHGGIEDHLTGEADQYFSDRRSAAGAPFDPARRDRIQLNLYGRRDTSTLRIELVLLTWGARRDLQRLRVDNGVVLGDGPSVGNKTPSALYGLTLGTTTV